MSEVVSKDGAGASAPVLSVDFETRSRVDLKHTGAHVYAQHPSTDIWCMGFAFGDDEVDLWVPPQWGGDGRLLLERLWDTRRDIELRAWNARFERLIWTHILGPRYGFPVPELEQFVDTAAEAAAMALPRALEDAAKVLGLPVEKDAAGHRLMKQMARPRKPTKNNPSEWWDDEERRHRLYEYCKQDVRVERAVAQKLRRLSPHERELYLLDQRINDRGVRVDVQLVHAAKRIVSIAEERADAQLTELTDGAVTSISQRDRTKEWLQGRGVEIENLRKDTLRDLLASPDELGEIERAVAELRADNAKSSTKKLDKFLSALGDDERIRDLLLYHGAGTGRWAGKLIQPQNFPRGEYWSNSGQLVRLKNVEQYIPLVLAGDYDALLDSGHPPLAIISALLRPMLIASPGRRLVAADFAQIEARVLAWIAEQDDLVQMFAEGGKIYEDMAAFMQTRKLGRPVSIDEILKDSVERQLGKNTVLGCGFQMGWETFQEQAWVQQAVAISDEDAQLAVRSYRDRYPMIVQFWYDIERAAIRAVERPGSVQCVGRNGAIRFKHVGNWLWCVLPSGRPLAYANPHIAVRKTKWGPKRGLAYYGISSRGNNRKWRVLHAYGGLLTENVVQAMARDIMASAMLRAERNGYPVVLTVHDEVVTDTPIGHGSAEHFEKLMCVKPRWAEGLPVAAEAWEGERYRK